MTVSDYLVLIDTTIHGAAVARAEWEGAWRIVKSSTHADVMGSAAALTTLWDDCREQNLPRHVLVSQGPGSFTGIKVGLSFAYGLVFGGMGTMTLSGYSSLEAAAHAFAEATAKDELALVLPATRTHGFMAHVKGSSVSSCLFEVARDAPRLAKLPSKFLVKPWQELEALVSGIEMTSPNSVMESGFVRALRDLPRSPGSNAVSFVEGLPTPRYLRLSTAEEKVGLRSVGDEAYGAPPEA